MGFVENLKVEQNNTNIMNLTENLAVAYKTTGEYLLDFNFKVTNLRHSSYEDVVTNFKKVYYSDSTIALKYLFYVGDIRYGLGERHIFKSCFKWLAETHGDKVKGLLFLIPEYSRWDVLVSLINCDNKKIQKEVTNIIRIQLNKDKYGMLNNRPISLLSKWLPSENASSKETKELAKIVRTNLKMTPKKYRKTLSILRAYLDVVETKMSANDWDKIDYSSVPSIANINYSNAFMKHDPQRRTQYLTDLKEGKTKINAGVLQPHQIVYRYANSYDGWYDNGSIRYDETLEELWKSLPDICTESTLVVRDGSGSMYTSVSGRIRAVDVATALAIYCAEHTMGEFNDKFITFSSRPKLIDLSHCESLADRIDKAYLETEMSNTDIFKTMMLVLKTAVKYKMEQEELPRNILIISDMQFDGSRFNLSKSLFDEIKDEFKKHGYKMPRICFWNLDPYDSETIPLKQNDNGLILCSGFSINNLNMFMSGEIDPLKVLLDILNSKRYDAVEAAIDR